MRLTCGSRLDSRYYSLEPYLEDSVDASLTGTLEHIDTKPNSSYLFLKNVSVQLKAETNDFYFSDFLVTLPKGQEDSLVSGNELQINGVIYPFLSPSNPGQFDEKAYYKEKNIFYKMAASTLHIKNHKTNPLRQFLYDLRKRLALVYESAMEEKDAGIITAMLLGDKTLLDTQIKTLYQTSGIGHILAISGLHVTILCSLLYRLLSLFRLPRPFPFLTSFLFLIGYGMMTGFGISTSRAVIMMLLGLFAAEIGRSYEPLTAAAVSAVWILLQKPYALFSCSFLLSYSAILGVFLTYPALKCLLLGNPAKQNARKRKRLRRQRKKPVKYFLSLSEKLLSSLLMSISIWITTLPVVLYFFYEIPTYGILLNLFVLPLVSTIVALSISAGLLGLLLSPAAAPLLYIVSEILHFYELLCHIFLSLPEPVLILGCPSLMQIILYYLILAMLLFYGNYICRPKKLSVNTAVLKGLAPVIFSFALLILLYREPVSGLQLTMLDVGQGDGLLLQTESGRTLLIDGGSTDVSNAGTYRILPYLKYCGIRRIDYMLMSHSDEDHISGQKELLESKPPGLKIGCYLMPYLPAKNQDENYRMMKEILQKADIPVYHINTGDCIESGALRIRCLHPDKDFTGTSANACSTTLSLTYGAFRMLLTGDLEGEGEEAVQKRLSQSQTPHTVLKVAHHGSKNSTGEAFLAAVRPKAAVISCGKNNRYGHPHADLLKRLRDAKAKIYQTPECGAVRIITDGKSFQILPFQDTKRRHGASL